VEKISLFIPKKKEILGEGRCQKPEVPRRKKNMCQQSRSRRVFWDKREVEERAERYIMSGRKKKKEKHENLTRSKNSIMRIGKGRTNGKQCIKKIITMEQLNTVKHQRQGVLVYRITKRGGVGQ